ncbi:Oxygen-insensitive NADPH nitroreductase [hydrothermal vent metagenome]|uniref:Oxygen-insensitive NADPH nitroreductase n=1 Tax=hydrothermal vent metagenome TaxID=652676 RepID=A0A160TTD0_9ZZZZ
MEEILSVARRAPSGTNMQPWWVYVVTDDGKNRLSDALLKAHDGGASAWTPEYQYYPNDFQDPYKSRRRKVGWDLYGLLDIERGQKDKMHQQHGRNFRFFDAPVGLMFTVDRELKIGSWLDYGMFIQNVMLAAREKGLHTCPQAAFTGHHQVIRECLPIPDEQSLVCGMSLGYADPDAIENSLITEREPVDSFTRFIDS